MIHDALLATVQAHSSATPMESAPVPPPDSNEEAELVTDGWQRALVGPVGLDTLVVAELPHAADQRHAVRTQRVATGGTRAATPPDDAQRSPQLDANVGVAM